MGLEGCREGDGPVSITDLFNKLKTRPREILHFNDKSYYVGGSLIETDDAILVEAYSALA